MTHTDTIAAIATAPGRAAIGVVRVSGPNLDTLVDKLLGRGLPARRAVVCRFLAADGTAIDQGLAIRFPAPHSYTGEDVLELQGHGGPVVLQMVLQRCLELGARVAHPGEFTRRAFLNDKIDLAQAEGVIDLIDAATRQAARCAARSMTGLFSSKIQELIYELIDLRAHVEAHLDFPEEELEVAAISGIEGKITHLARQVAGVLDASRQGSLLRDGIDVVLAGQPNVGKSTLLNQLAGEELAIVTDVPGTTRDVIRQLIDLDGIPVRMIDTAGLRTTTDVVEKAGVERTWSAIGQADLVILMMDARKGETEADAAIIDRLPADLPCLKAMNKIDLASIAPRVEATENGPQVWLSAQTGVGLDLLRETVLLMVGWHSHSSEGLYLARTRHLAALGEAMEDLRGARASVPELDLVAEELRLVQHALSRIAGEFTADDLLGEIFARFCIGK
jgi:tRNA modification GTPase